jgi:hypothetical protein
MKSNKLIANKFKPVNWLTITLGQYMELIELIKGIQSEDVIKTGGVTDMDIMFEIVRCLYGEEAEDLTLPEYSKLLVSLSFLGERIPKISVKKFYELGGKKYQCNMDLSKVIGNQYIDYMNYIRQGNGNENLSKLVSVFLIPEGCKYNEGYDIKELQNLIEDEMKIIDVNAIAFFLPNFLNAYMVYTLKSLLLTMKKMMKKEKNQMKKEELMKKITEIEDKMGQLIVML